MAVDRREVLKLAGLAGCASVYPAAARAEAVYAPRPGGWRTFDVVTRIELLSPGDEAQAWIPLPAFEAAEWFKPAGSTWAGNETAASVKSDGKYGAKFLHATWSQVEKPILEVTSRFATRDRSINLSRPGQVAELSEQERRLYTEGTALIPVDGIVKATADQIVGAGGSDFDKARKIYDWVVENSSRNAKTRGCGIGDVAAMLKSGNLTGKCADLNALYVGLARAAGLPARDVYGLRVAPSAFGYKSLGAGSEVVTKAQHCRAEVWLSGFGWVPVDPADVRKVALEEPPANLALSDAKVVAARKALFGAWEMNWLAYNDAHDIVLPGAKGPTLEFLMYPQAETAAGGRLDSLDPDSFVYKITARRIET